MKYRFLGNSGLMVSEICFGVMTFTGQNGWTHLGKMEQKEADKLTSIALDSGINIFDTADIYSNGVSEIMLGKALGERRQDAIITTKCGFRMSPGPNGDGLSRRRIIQACEGSLQRLGIDYIDLYLIHSFDFITPLEETLSTFDLLLKQGKVRYIGCSNFMAWQLMKALSMQEKNSWEKFICLQAYYSLVGRDLELEILPACIDQGVGLMIWGPLHGGILSGKYHNASNWPKETRIKAPGEHLPYDEAKGDKIIDELFKISLKRGVTVSQAALNYLLRKQGVSTVVIGARNEKQLNENIASADWELDTEEIKRLDKLSAPPEIYPHWYFDIYRKDRLKR